MAPPCKPLGQALTSSAWINPPQHESRGAGLLDFVFLQARDRGDSRLQPFATFSQYINPWKVTCKPTQQKFCTCLLVERLKHSWFEHREQEQWGLVGHQIHCGVRHGWTWVLWHSPTLPSAQIPSICHSEKPAGQMDMHTALIKASTKPSSSYKMYV